MEGLSQSLVKSWQGLGSVGDGAARDMLTGNFVVSILEMSVVWGKCYNFPSESVYFIATT